MSGSIPNQLNFGSFVPTTNVWEIQQIQSSNIDPNLKEILVRLYQNINNISNVLNGKDSGFYSTEEFLTGKLFFPQTGQTQQGASTPQYRSVFRKVVSFGPLPNATTINIPHNIDINSGYILTGLNGFSTTANSDSMIPLPFASPNALNEAISIEIDPINIIITTGIDYSAYTTTYVVLEYLKS
jgi:hypothetical protein